MAKENIFQKAMNFLKETYNRIVNPNSEPEIKVDLGNVSFPTNQPPTPSIRIDNNIMNRVHEELDYYTVKQLEKNPEKLNSTLKLGLGHFIQEEFRNNPEYRGVAHLENNIIVYTNPLSESVNKEVVFENLKNKVIADASWKLMNYLSEPEFAKNDYITKLIAFNGNAYSSPEEIHNRLQNLCKDSTIRVFYDPFPPLKDQIKTAMDSFNRQQIEPRQQVIGDMML